MKIVDNRKLWKKKPNIEREEEGGAQGGGGGPRRERIEYKGLVLLE